MNISEIQNHKHIIVYNKDSSIYYYIKLLNETMNHKKSSELYITNPYIEDELYHVATFDNPLDAAKFIGENTNETKYETWNRIYKKDFSDTEYVEKD